MSSNVNCRFFTMNRRTLLKSSLLSTSALLLPRFVKSAFADDFQVIEARLSKYNLAGSSAGPADVWTYDGVIPGPEIRVRRGEEVRVRLLNKLPEATTIHWHGIRLPNAMDGVPDLTQKAVEPGENFNYHFHVPDAGTFWYHTHNRSSEQMARGLYGTLIVEEPGPKLFVNELSLVIDDWRLLENGQIEISSFGNMMDNSHAGRYGNWITVNGKDQPFYKIERSTQTRIRLINTCNSRILQLKIPGLNAHVIARDGQPISPEYLGDEVLDLAPAQRVDLSVEANANSPDKLQLFAQTRRGQSVVLAGFQIQTGLQLPEEKYKVPPELPTNPISKELTPSHALRAELRMQGGAMGRMETAIYKGKEMGIRQLVRFGQVWAFNGIVGMTDEPLLDASVGQTVLITIKNETAWPHAMHLHGHHFKVLERNNQKLKSEHWIDTVLINRAESVTIAFVADNPGKWLIHCHMLEHQAAGMKTWFNVSA